MSILTIQDLSGDVAVGLIKVIKSWQKLRQNNYCIWSIVKITINQQNMINSAGVLYLANNRKNKGTKQPGGQSIG